MADTLRALAGDKIFKDADVIAALHAPLTPEQIVLDRYVLLPQARSGIAAALSISFDWALPTRATVAMRVPVVDDRGPLDAEMQVHVYGPADVLEFDPRQIIRTFPKADADTAEPDNLAHIEFDRPDMPWLFTPAGPDPAGRLVPWITLVVAERRYLQWGERRGTTRQAQIRRDQLQPLGDAWAWAHAQVMGAKAAARETQPTIEQRLSESNAAHNVSRLLCPRRLKPQTAYVACVVPTFLAGAQAGLGLTPVTTLTPAWGTAANFGAGDPFDRVVMPVYFSWDFSTGEAGNFESLARNLRPAVAPPGVGRRRVDATHPWTDFSLAASDPGAEMIVTGPVVSPQPPENEPDAQWPVEAAQEWTPSVTAGLIAKLNLPDQQAHMTNPGAPLVGPPLYGGLHAQQPRIETEAPADAAQPAWFRELNMDPRHRIVGGLGTRVVQAEQEDLMLAAWNQLAGLEPVNRALRLAQLAKHVGASLHRRHLSRLSDAAVLAVTERVHAKVLDIPTRSIWASLEASSLPRTVTTGAFRRLARVRGPVVKASVRASPQRLALVESLTVKEDRLTTSWVLSYAAPDGIRNVSATAQSRLTAAIAGTVGGQADPNALLAQWRTDLARLGITDLLTPAVLATVRVPGATLDVSRAFVNGLLQRVVRAAPAERDIAADREVAINGMVNALLLRELIGIAGQFGVQELVISAADVKRLGLNAAEQRGESASLKVTPDALQAYADRVAVAARAHNVGENSVQDAERTASQLRKLAESGMRIDSRKMLAALAAIGAKVVAEDPFTEAARGRINAPALELVRKLDPAITVPARILARLKGGSGRFPGWLRANWFADGRVEPVMAHPRFAYPMAQALYRYDREWIIPGLGLIERPDMATLLTTNSRFIEAYLVGLNHEMARELLWREFPTDQRGTYFSSFWGTASELVADLHEVPWRSGVLGAHMDPKLDGQLVFLVRGDLIRRYPGVVAHAAREASREKGIPIFEATSPAQTLFHIVLAPNVLLVGFALTQARVQTPGETWWFTLSENPTEPRFGLDAARAEPISRDSLVWGDFGVDAAGAFLDASKHTDIAFDGSRWGASSAQIAYLLFQLPARAAFLASRMISGALAHA